jgi:hypothetical protein
VHSRSGDGYPVTTAIKTGVTVTMAHDHHLKAVASGSLPLPWLEPILSAVWQAVAA